MKSSPERTDIREGLGPEVQNPDILDLAPSLPRTVEDTGLNIGMLTDLCLKHLYYRGMASGIEIASNLRLPWSGVVNEVVDFLVEEKWADIRGGKGFGRVSVDFILTERGRTVAREAIARSAYDGPAPIPIAQYNALIKKQGEAFTAVSGDDLIGAFDELVLPPDLMGKFGPAINANRSLFLFGPPGNGKTTIAEIIGAVIPGEVFVPDALEVDGQIIKVFDPICHREVPQDSIDTCIPGGKIDLDTRWHLCRRPAVIAGGELTLETLDLIWNHDSRFYEAPFQVKANGGMLLIDDFGRQRVHPADLLNRWIVPLEKHIDYLTLHTGKKFDVPFDELVVFSTNLDPKDLVDEAFLRRIKYKIPIENPTEEAYREIFARMCEKLLIPYNDSAVSYIMDTYYRRMGIELRACHPRDILTLLRDAARFHKRRAVLSQDLVDQACQSFFVVL